MRCLMIVCLLVFATHLQSVTSLAEKDIVDGSIHVNEDEVALQIEVVVPVEDNNTASIQGLLDSFFETTNQMLVNKPKVKVCLVVNFPAAKGDQHGHSWRCVQPLQLDKSEWKSCVEKFILHRAQHDNSSEPEVDHDKIACQRPGAPEVKLLVKKVDAAAKEKEVIDSALGNGSDLVLMVSSFNASTISPFRSSLYGADKPRSPKHQRNQSGTFGDAYREASTNIWTAVQDLLRLCKYSIVSSACYYSPGASVENKEPKNCTLGYARNGTASQNHRKYCVSNYAFVESTKCVQEKCEESCRKVLEHENCNCQMGSRGQRRVFVPAKRSRDEERHLWKCLGYGPEKVFVDCDSGECESPGGIAMITIGLLILVVTICVVFTVYWLCFRQRKPAPPKPEQPVSPPSMPPMDPTPLDPPPEVEGKSGNTTASSKSIDPAKSASLKG